MINIKKSFVSLLVIVMVCTMLPSSVLANNDSDPPVFSEFVPYKTTAVPGETISFTVKIEEESELGPFNVNFYAPNHNQYASSSLTLVSGNTYSGEFTLPSNALAGEWYASFSGYDIYNNYSNWQAPNTITVNSPHNDMIGPTFSAFTPNKTTANPGDKITFTVKVEDQSSVNSELFSANLYAPNHNQYAPSSLTLISGNTYSGEFTLPSNALAGEWYASFSGYDVYKNYSNWQAPNIITVGGSNSDTTGPTFSAFTPNRTTANPGDTIAFTVKVEEESELGAFNAILYAPNHNQYVSSSLTLVSGNVYSGEFTLPDNALVGNWYASFTGYDVYSNHSSWQAPNEITVTSSPIDPPIVPPGGQDDEKETAPKTKIHTATKTVYLKKGSSVTLPVLAYTGDKTSSKFTWSSSKKKIATVNSKGKIKARKKGTTKITAKSKDGTKLKLTIKVISKNIKVKKITIKGAPKSMKVGAKKYLTAKISPKKATKAIVKWSSSNKKVLTIDKAGRIVAKGKGKAKITAKIGKKKVSKTITVSE